jgi:8-oxo-dGTP pyrophosphatase MutT (NUDIX family)
VNATGCEVLLTHHRKLDRWLQLGGHADGDGDVLGVAMKEAEEESGLTDFSHVGHGIFDIDIHLIPERKGEPAHFHYDVRYVLRANGCLDFTVSEESHDLRWVKLDGVKTLTSEPSMMRMVAKWSKQWVYQSRQMRLISACFFCSAAGVARSSGKTDEHGNRLCRLGELTES